MPLAIGTLAAKDLRLLSRDTRSAIILLVMPLIFILVLGISLGEGFGQKPDDRLRISIVSEDLGCRNVRLREAVSGLTMFANMDTAIGGLALWHANRAFMPPAEPWADVVRRDLETTAEIRVEVIPDRQTAEQLVRDGKRSAVLIFLPKFSEQITLCSFLADGINPFYRDGVYLKEVGAELLRDPTQMAAAAIIDQVCQVTLLRVILPWMIGRAFDKLSEPLFMSMLADEVPGGKMLPEGLKRSLGSGVKEALKKFFPKYNLTGKNWADLTKSEAKPTKGPGSQVYSEEGGSGFLQRGAVRYQILVPSYTVMFAFFLVLTVGWLFVAERRQGTLKRLRAAPLSRTQILLGKLLPCLVLSLIQGLFLLAMGRLVFGMKLGSAPLWLLGVVAATSVAAMGLAMLIASLARTETQVAVYGTLIVLVLAGISGCLMPRELMPESMKELSRITPHAWALDAYNQLLLNPEPNLALVAQACLVLTGFGLAFLTLAWLALRLE